jgi:hypothetical protein
MHWVVLAVGLVSGGIIRFIHSKKKNKVLNVLSFVVPFAFGVAFWILLFKSGYQGRAYSTTVRGLEYTGATKKMANWIMVGLTSCVFVGISWCIGGLISLLAGKISSKK